MCVRDSEDPQNRFIELDPYIKQLSVDVVVRRARPGEDELAFGVCVCVWGRGVRCVRVCARERSFRHAPSRFRDHPVFDPAKRDSDTKTQFRIADECVKPKIYQALIIDAPPVIDLPTTYSVTPTRQLRTACKSWTTACTISRSSMPLWRV